MDTHPVARRYDFGGWGMKSAGLKLAKLPQSRKRQAEKGIVRWEKNGCIMSVFMVRPIGKFQIKSLGILQVEGRSLWRIL